MHSIEEVTVMLCGGFDCTAFFKLLCSLFGFCCK